MGFERRGQLDFDIGKGVISGAFRGEGRNTVAVRGDGSMVLIQTDGTTRLLGKKVNAAPAPVISGNGHGVVFRGVDGVWRWSHTSWNVDRGLRDVAHDAFPVLSHDGLKVAYRTNKSAWLVGDASAGGAVTGFGLNTAQAKNPDIDGGFHPGRQPGGIR